MSNVICIPSNIIEKEIYQSIPLEYKYEIVRAYGLFDNYTEEELNKKIKLISETKKTYSNLLNVIYSSRHPYIIMLIASNIGMYIPGSKRYGSVAYSFYIANVKYYEKIINKDNNIPTLKDIYMSDKKLDLLLSMRDDQILVSNFTYTINYSDRLAMLKNFIKTNIDVYGYFSIPSNSRSIYNSESPSIFYSNTSINMNYSTSIFLKLIDENEKCVYTSFEKTAMFSFLPLLHLRKLILEKLVKWRLRDNNDDIAAPKLYKIVQKLDKVLENQTRISLEIFFKTHTISI